MPRIKDICISKIQNALDNKMSEKEIADILDDFDFTQIEAEMRFKKRAIKDEELHDILQRIKDDAMQQSMTNIKHRIRQNKQNALDFEIGKAYENFGEHIEAKMKGSFNDQTGAGNSYNSRQRLYIADFVGKLHSKLKNSGLDRIAKTKGIGREIIREMFGESTGNKSAQRIAAILSDRLDYSRNVRNQFGAGIGKLKNYQGKQIHLASKIRKYTKDEWKTDIKSKLDTRTFGDTDPDLFLDYVYDDILYGKLRNYDDPLKARGLQKDVITRTNRSRKLFFKDADSFWDYNMKYGYGDNVVEMVSSQLMTAARDAAHLETFGPSVRAYLDNYSQMARESYRGNDVELQKLEKHIKRAEKYINVIDGSIHSHDGGWVSRASVFYRQLKAMASLGGVAVAQLGDLPIASSIMALHGIRLGNSYRNLFLNLFNFVKKRENWNTATERAVLESYAVGIESLQGGALFRAMPEDTLTGRLHSSTRWFFKLTGMDRINDLNKSAVGLILTNQLGENRGVKWADLDTKLKSELGRYNIDEKQWNVLRDKAVQAENGKWYLDADAVNKVTDEEIKKINSWRKSKDLQSRIDKYRLEMDRNLKTYVVDSVDNIILTPGIEDISRQTQLLGPAQSQSPGVIASKMLMQFKNFPFMVLNKGVLRIAKNKNVASVPLLTQMVVSTTMMGFVAMTVKDLAAGKKPQPIDDPRTWVRALTQGGALGIYGDFLFGIKNRIGGSVLGTLGGPFAGDVEKALNIGSAIMNGDFEKVPQRTFSLLKHNIPFANLVYGRLLFDHFIFNNIAEQLNPGYKKRLEKWAEKEQGQEYWFKPTEF